MIILEINDQIHLKSIRGIYTILGFYEQGIIISDRKSIARANYPKYIPTKQVLFSDVKCFAGGFNAPRRTIKTIEIKTLDYEKKTNQFCHRISHL